MSRICPRCLETNPTDRLAQADVVLREEPDEEEEDEGDRKEDDEDEDTGERLLGVSVPLFVSVGKE